MTTDAYRWPDAPRPPVLALSGDLDINTSSAVSAQLRDHAKRHGSAVLVVDLTDVSFMDSSGLDSITQAYDALAAVDRLLVAQSLGPSIHRFFRMINTLRTVPLVQQTLRNLIDQPDRPPRQDPDLQLRGLVQDSRAAVPISAETERAKGVLMGMYGCNAEQAGLLLALIARRRHVSVREVATGRLRAFSGAQAHRSVAMDVVGRALCNDVGS